MPILHYIAKRTAAIPVVNYAKQINSNQNIGAPMYKFENCLCGNYFVKIGIFIAILLGFFLLMHIVINYYHQNTIAILNAVGLIYGTLIIVFIAWFQLKGLRKTAQGDFLLRIDNSFRDEKIQDAVHIVYLLDRNSTTSCRDHELRTQFCLACEAAVTNDMRRELDDIWRSNTPKGIEERFSIKTYLDHLETLSYFANSGYVQLYDINELHGGIIRYHCDLFSNWIENVRRTDSEAYSQLLALSRKL